MTDNDIIKALSKISLGGHYCMKCKHEITKGDDRCGIKGCKIARNALDLINRQQAEIERYKGVIKLLEKDVKDAQTELNEFKAIQRSDIGERHKESN